ncbi:D-methionine transport system ATP-binding protein [Salsuginibacillus halophilus]|uniref:D-methionine transport system ATP-binding protein n=1 Tax=Salsuginibacillus halophilus TaxID=517424 RepID=A0A2P8HDZ5_9BACI|nr:methionine ABC transporter ATP-binding protein [Salsuginibacillus halophilus]PSL44425.1 D-methionine transport system ATP-binding protein [Salsuginibacillus halophilus]
MIRLKQLEKVFQTKTQNVAAVQNVELSIEEGEIFGIIGYSGAGKSTLVRMLNMLEPPTSGSVEVSGQDLTKLRGQKLREARQDIGMIFQHFNLLWSRTVAENIAFPLEVAGVDKAERETRVHELVGLVGLEGRESAYPSQLSGGQKQRVGIARALANRPKVLLCDEATSALDPETTDSILQLITNINQELGLTVVMITHEMHVIRKVCHKVAVMENGGVVEQGPVLDVFQRPQQEVTKGFVKQIAAPDDEQAEAEGIAPPERGQLARLSFVGASAGEPVVSRLIRTVEVDVNILQGRLATTVEGSYGTMLVHIDGTAKAVEEAFQYLEKAGVEAEVVRVD